MRLRPLALVVPLLLAACGDDGGGSGGSGGGGGDAGGLSAEEQAFADAFAASLADDEDGFGVTQDEADCMGTAVMAELGTEPFDEAGVTAEDVEAEGEASSPGELLGDGAVSDAQAEAILEVWEDECVDLVEVMMASAGSDLDLDPEGKDCFEEGLRTDDLGRRMLMGSFTAEDGTPDQATVAEFLRLLEDCGSSTGGPGGLTSVIAESLAEDGTLTEEQATCLAQGMVDELGTDRLSELFADGSFDELDESGQSEVTGAMFQAAVACDVPLSAFG